MATSNRDRVGQVMDALKAGLGPYALREYKQAFGGMKYAQEIEAALISSAFKLQLPNVPINSDADLQSVLLSWLKTDWPPAGSDKLAAEQITFNRLPSISTKI